MGLYREEVCQLTNEEMMGRSVLRVEKNFPSTEQAKVDRFNTAVEPHIKDLDGIDIKVAAILGVGD